MSTTHQQEHYSSKADEAEREISHNSNSQNVIVEHHGAFPFERPHRAEGELELGITEILEGRKDTDRRVVLSKGLESWHGRQRFEAHRPDWVAAFVAEVFGTLFYCFSGQMANASFIITSIQGEAQGDLTMIGLAYALGIAFSIIVCATTSGGHFNPCVTIAQVVFKGFPLKKAPVYIAAQLIGSFMASLMVIASWRHELQAATESMTASGQREKVFSGAGPAGSISVFAKPGRSYGSVFANEFFGDLLIGFVIWANLDHSNPFSSPDIAPYTIGLAFGVVVWACSPGSVATNTARDLGSRFACAIFWSRAECFPPQETAITALTNIPAMLVAASIYMLLLSDSRRPPAKVIHESNSKIVEEEMRKAEQEHDLYLEQRISRTVSRGGDPSELYAKRTQVKQAF